jgi:hypothetical protein
MVEQSWPRNPEPYRQKKSKKPLFMLFLGIVIGILIMLPIVLIVTFYNPTPDWKQYEKRETEDTILYENEELEVIFEIDKNRYPYSENKDGYSYTFTDVNDVKTESPHFFSSTEDLLDYLYSIRERLSEDQMNWYEYICRDVID